MSAVLQPPLKAIDIERELAALQDAHMKTNKDTREKSAIFSEFGDDLVGKNDGLALPAEKAEANLGHRVSSSFNIENHDPGWIKTVSGGYPLPQSELVGVMVKNRTVHDSDVLSAVDLESALAYFVIDPLPISKNVHKRGGRGRPRLYLRWDE